METVLNSPLGYIVQNYQAVQALAGIILFSATAYYSYGIVQNLKEKQEYALARFFLKRKTSRSFLVISVSALILSFGMTLKNIGKFTGQESYVAIALMSHVLMLFGVLYFTFNIYLITRPGLDHASGRKSSEEENKEETQ
ncbi:MAG: hypothetical protein ABEJ87_03865 [Candidatus Nanohalobium sp.]